MEMMEHERGQELEALDLALMGIEAALRVVPEESAWCPCFREIKNVLAAQVAQTAQQHPGRFQ